MLQRCAAVLAAAIMTVACAQTDAGITTNVKTKLAADDTVKAYKVDVDTRNGVVTLSGEVESAAAKEQALQIARQTDGVRDVIDQIHVGEAAATAGTYRDNDTDIDDRAADAARRGASEVREESREAADKAGDIADKTGAAVTDAAITTAVKTKFLADSTVKGLRHRRRHRQRDGDVERQRGVARRSAARAHDRTQYRRREGGPRQSEGRPLSRIEWSGTRDAEHRVPCSCTR